MLATKFYNKLYDLQGRNVTIGVVDYAPYCVTTKAETNQGNVDAFNSSLSKELFVRGTEGSLIVEFCKMRNCNIRLSPSNGSFHLLFFYTWHHHFLDSSQYIAKSSVTLMVPRAKLLPMSLTIIYPFDYWVWVSIFIMLAVMTAIHHLITSLNFKHGNKSAQPPIEKSIFDMISIYLDQGIFPNSVSSSYRWLIAFVLISGVVLSNSYSRGLASVLTIPKYGKSIETIHNFVQTTFRWGDPSYTWILSLIGADSYDIQQVVKQFDEVPDEQELYQRSLAGDYGVGVELLNSGNYAFGSYIRDDNLPSSLGICDREGKVGSFLHHMKRGNIVSPNSFIVGNKTCPEVKVLDCKQLRSASIIGGKTVYTPSDSFRVTFAGSALPSHVSIHRVRLPVRLY
ncbi:uncharacterized protein LOC129720297 [Wyeomyia smithii]|uniref:uncharacterized protein LOC129720297 n=1 Tax=Wyeomyia smithii TaxID=174621 RepID=UPI002468030D|nr:uncharacterized protein LOC129720297 [Wyeomyia smithii]